MSQPKIMTGARAIFKLNGKVMAYASNASYRKSLPIAAVNVLGKYAPKRLEPLGVDVTVTCAMLRYPGKGGTGNSPENLGLHPRLDNMLDSEDIRIELQDRKTGQFILIVERARLTDGGGSLDSRGLLTENYTFIGILAESSDAPDQAEAVGVIPANDEE